MGDGIGDNPPYLMDLHPFLAHSHLLSPSLFGLFDPKTLHQKEVNRKSEGTRPNLLCASRCFSDFV